MMEGLQNRRANDRFLLRLVESVVRELLRRAKGEELVTPENQREMVSPTYDGTSGLDCTAEQLEAAMVLY